MQDNDFDKIFKHKFEQVPGAPYSEGNWSELSQRMDEHGRRRQRWLTPVLLPLLGLLAGGNLFWWQQWRDAEHRFHASTTGATTVKNDTVIHRTVVYHFDTVYQQVTYLQPKMALQQASQASVLPVSATPPSALPSLSASNGTILASESAVPAGQPEAVPNSFPLDTAHQANSRPAPALQQTPPGHGKMPTPDHTLVHKVPADTSLLSPPQAATAPAVTDTTEATPIKEQEPATKQVKSPFITIGRPRIGASALLGIPNLPDKLSGAVLGGGIRADIAIARNFRLGAEVAYQQASMKSEDTEILEELDIKIPKPGGDFYLKYWETYFLPAFTYALHLRYEIPLNSSWTPWIGAGVQATTSLPFEIEFEFENDVNNLEEHIEASSEAETGAPAGMLMAGAECRLKTHLFFGVEGFLLHGFGEEPGLLDRQFGLKTSLMYKF